MIAAMQREIVYDVQGMISAFVEKLSLARVSLVRALRRLREMNSMAQNGTKVVDG